MTPHSSLGWEEWEEDNLLAWLNAHRKLSWSARARAYFEQYGLTRTVESLRGKKYHILRKRRLHRTKAPEPPESLKRPKRPRRPTPPKSDSSCLSNRETDRINRWLQVPADELGIVDDECATEKTKSVYLTPISASPPPHARPTEERTRSWFWDYVHRICAT